MIDISNGVKLSLHLYITIHLFIQPITGLPLQLSIGVIVPLHFFSLIHFDTLSLHVVLNGVRLAGLITFQADAVGLPVYSWVRRIGTVSATFKLADRPILGED